MKTNENNNTHVENNLESSIERFYFVEKLNCSENEVDFLILNILAQNDLPFIPKLIPDSFQIPSPPRPPGIKKFPAACISVALV